MKYLAIILLTFTTIAAIVSAATTPTQNVTQVISTKAVNDNIVIPSGKSITINSGASIINNGTATGFGGGGSGSGTVTSVNASVPGFLSVAGVPITSSGTISISYSGTALPVANGGTGQTSWTDGQIPIGNTTGNTLTKATLTAGSGITITNGHGSISLSIASSAITNAMLAGSIGTDKLSVSSNVKSVLDAADFAAIRTVLSLRPGTEVQAWSSNLDTLSTGFGTMLLGPGIVSWDGSAYAILGTVPPRLGGTGINSFSISYGDLLYGANGGSAWSLLAGNTTTTTKLLMSTGTGLTAQAPAWTALTAGSGITINSASGAVTVSIANSAITDAMLAGSISNSKLSTNPLARANHTGTQTLSTISDAGSLAALSSVTSAYITDGTIVNADISSSAAIALSKLATDPLARANHTGTQAASTITALPVEIVVACSDETTDLTTGTAKVTFRMPHAMTVSSVRLNVNTAPTGSVIIVDVKESGTTIFSTKPQIATSAKTSVGGAVPGTLSDTSLADDAEVTINLDQIGSTIAGKGLKVSLIGTR